MNDTLASQAASEPAAVWAAALGTGGVFVLMIVVVWQIAATWRARMLAGREEEYRRLAAKYAELLEDNTEILRRYSDELAQVRTSVGSVERMMREVD
ncbi:hypothetical protein SAMN06297387_1095 [Streptomyces zhaozhouensis]|uniref:Uncharacterized protein n=1 Tax=Streptomyces zhaozhouensis TaxID=1300267 RepID=A0A286DWX9_9ACTN|nr:hypothetical protein [Streptomyces zhaozhouensis]SOD63064.1 hypothetical protein SAMN06297387_1095 [Streptomyces zhaozhouensis]